MTSRHRILILDTNEDVLIRLEKLLEDEGFDTTTTWKIGDALELLRSMNFDLFLIGDRSLQVNGAEILTEWKVTSAGAPCVVIRPIDRHLDDLCSHGVHAVIGNWNFDSIADTVKQCIAASVRSRELDNSK